MLLRVKPPVAIPLAERYEGLAPWKIVNGPRAHTTFPAFAVGSGVGYLTAIALPKGYPVAGVGFCCGSVGGSGMTHTVFAFYDQGDGAGNNLNKLAQSADDTSATWDANVERHLNLQSTVWTSYEGLFFLYFHVAGTTPPRPVNQPGAIQTEGIAPPVGGQFGSGFTTTAPATVTALDVTGILRFWGGVL